MNPADQLAKDWEEVERIKRLYDVIRELPLPGPFPPIFVQANRLRAEYLAEHPEES